jgi:hypothetical protein
MLPVSSGYMFKHRKEHRQTCNRRASHFVIELFFLIEVYTSGGNVGRLIGWISAGYS